MANDNGNGGSGYGGYFVHDADDDAMPTDTTIAWEKLGRWSATHETRDFGVTTVCGKTVPVDAETTDSTSDTGGKCKRCLAIAKLSGGAL